MSSGVNKQILVGNLGAEPELRFTQSNRAVLKFRMATTRNYSTDSGETREDTQWHNVVIWGKRAEALSKILTKGTRVYVEGRTEHRQFEKQDGTKGYVTEVVMEELVLLGGGADRETGDARERVAGKAPPKPSVRETEQKLRPSVAGDDDVGF